MVINFKTLDKHGFSWKNSEVLVMQCIHQKEYELLEDCRDILNGLYKKDFISLIKRAKKDTPTYMKARLTKKGKSFLKDLQVAEITQESKLVAFELIEMYSSKNLNIGNKKKIVELVAWFIAESQIDADTIADTVNDYILKEDPKFTSKLENLIWKGDSVFSTAWNLSQSKLYQMITQNN